MTRKRKAILIESGLISLAPPLLGAKHDVENWENYLRTPLGGCWGEPGDEIKPMALPSKHDLLEQLTSLNYYDYAFITFSGHGGYKDSNDEDFIFLNGREIITINEIRAILKPVINKATIIIDACRNKTTLPAFYEDANNQKQDNAILESTQRPSREYNRNPLFESTYINGFNSQSTAKKKDIVNKWWEAVEDSSEGNILIQSCTHGESAFECNNGTQSFGLFSRLMLDAAYIEQFSSILSVEDAFIYAKNELAKRFSSTLDSQTPELTSSCPYPFSVKINHHMNLEEYGREEKFKGMTKSYYDNKQILLEFAQHKPIPETKKSYQIDKQSTFSYVQKNAHHVFEKPNGEGKELRVVNMDGSEHDDSKNPMSKHEINFFKNLGFNIPDNGLIGSVSFDSLDLKSELFIFE